MEDKKQVVKEAVGHLLDHLSQVNVELGYSHKRGEDSDVNQQEEYAVDWAQKLVKATSATDSRDPFLLNSLARY